MNRHRAVFILVAVVLALVGQAPDLPAAATTTVFTYQGQLNNNDSPAAGNFDFQFKLFDAAMGGAQVGTTQSVNAVVVSQGVFTTALDFGAVFNGTALWLEIAVRPAGGGGYTLLAPRQALTAAPYALSLAPGAVVSGGVAGSMLRAVNTNADAIALRGDANSAGAVGVWGQANAGTAVYGATSGGRGVWGESNASGTGVYGKSSAGTGVWGESTEEIGVFGYSGSYTGVWGQSGTGEGVYGESNSGAGVRGLATAATGAAYGVVGESDSTSGRGIYGVATSDSGPTSGVRGRSDSTTGNGVFGHATALSGSTVGVLGWNDSTAGTGVLGQAFQSTGSAHGVVGKSSSSSGIGVLGQATSATGSGVGVWGDSWSPGGYGVLGVQNAADAVAVKGLANSGINSVGVWGESADGVGVYGKGTGPGSKAVWGISFAGSWAGYFDGHVRVTGTLMKDAGGFQIDHPLDPANQFLNHSFVESPDMKNLYDGVVVLDDDGAAVVTLPHWFEGLNGGADYAGDYRYQLTPIGAAMPNLHIAAEIDDDTFTIAGGVPGMKVSWLLTGIRHDPYAETHRIAVEQVKPASELGTYLHPELYGQPASLAQGHGQVPQHGEDERQAERFASNR